MTFFRDNQRLIAYSFIGTGFSIIILLLLGEYLISPIIWINNAPLQIIAVAVAYVGLIIEFNRNKNTKNRFSSNS